jgi:hypothetical protein
MMCFKFKQHPGDLMRDASIKPIPDPIKEQEDFWLWFHPCYQSSQDIADLDDLYKLLHDECDDDDLLENEFYEPYTALSKPELQKVIDEYEMGITADCFENFYQLVASGMIEIIER